MDYDFPFSWEWNVIIPTDFHSYIFQRDRYTTKQNIIQAFSDLKMASE